MVQDYRRWQAEGADAKASAVRAGLLKHRRLAPDGTWELLLSPLTAGGTDPLAALPEELRQQVAAFALDPWIRALRASLALDAMAESVDGGGTELSPPIPDAVD